MSRRTGRSAFRAVRRSPARCRRRRPTIADRAAAEIVVRDVMAAIVAHGAMATGIGIADRATTATGSTASARKPKVKSVPGARAIAVTMATRVDLPGRRPTTVDGQGNGAADHPAAPFSRSWVGSVPGFFGLVF